MDKLNSVLFDTAFHLSKYKIAFTGAVTPKKAIEIIWPLLQKKAIYGNTNLLILCF